jgi:hypothetical protein
MNALLPAEYLVGFLAHVKARTDVVLFDYDDLHFYGDTNFGEGYPTEWKQWLARRDPEKIYLTIQYDVDANPERTAAALRVHAKGRIPVNVMVFAHPLGGGVREYHAALHILYEMVRHEAAVVGYHCNVYERANFKIDRAYRLFHSDIESLDDHYLPISYWSPHGGKRDEDDHSNAHVITTPVEMAARLRHVHNRYGIRKHGQYSDGGISGERYAKAERDLVKFVAEMEPGKRYRVLLHPQYYGDEFTPHANLVGQEWYDRIIERGGDVWGI